MAFGKDHELHTRRWGRNLGLGLVLGTFALLIFGLSVVKISHLREGQLPAAEAKK